MKGIAASYGERAATFYRIRRDQPDQRPTIPQRAGAAAAALPISYTGRGPAAAAEATPARSKGQGDKHDRELAERAQRAERRV